MRLRLLVRFDNLEWGVNGEKLNCVRKWEERLHAMLFDSDGAGFSVASVSLKELRKMWNHGKVVFLICFMVLKFPRLHLLFL